MIRAIRCLLITHVLKYQMTLNSNIANYVGIARGFTEDSCNLEKGHNSFEAVLLCLLDGYHYVDLSLYIV